MLLGKVAKECRQEGLDWQILRQVSPTQSHQSNGTAEKAVSTVRGLARTYLEVLIDKIPVFWFNDTFIDAAVDSRTRSVLAHMLSRERRHTGDSVREDSWKKVQERNPATG